MLHDDAPRDIYDTDNNADFYFKFIPEKWQKDSRLQLCSLAARGLWLELLCIAHEAEGCVRVNGKPPTIKELAKLARSTPSEVGRLLAELSKYGVFSLDETDQAIMSRRMVREAQRRKIAKENGRKGGRPKAQSSDPDDNLTPNQIETQHQTKPEPNPNPDTKAPVAIALAVDRSGSGSHKGKSISTEPAVAWRRRQRPASLGAEVVSHQLNCAPWALAACERGWCIPKYLWPKWERRRDGSAEWLAELQAFVERTMSDAPTDGTRPEKWWPAVFEREFGSSTPAKPEAPRGPRVMTPQETDEKLFSHLLSRGKAAN